MFLVSLYAIAACLVGAVGIVTWQSFAWLRRGVWPTFDLSDLIATAGWANPHVSWLGADRLLQTAYTLPMSVVLAAAAFVLVMVITRSD